MLFRISLFVVILLVNNVVCEVKPSNLPCKLDDIECTSRMTQWMYDDAIAGNAEKGMDNLEPMKLDVIEGIQGYVNYTLKDNIIEGYSKCKIEHASFKAGVSKMHIIILCPRYHMTGSYDIEGSLINYPIRGKGPYYIITNNYNLTIDSDVVVSKKGNSLFAKLKTFAVVADLLGAADFELKNLFDGNKELSDPIHKFGKENPKIFASILDKPIFKVTIKKLMKNFNILLKDIPVIDLLQVKENELKIET